MTIVFWISVGVNVLMGYLALRWKFSCEHAEYLQGYFQGVIERRDEECRMLRKERDKYMAKVHMVAGAMKD